MSVDRKIYGVLLLFLVVGAAAGCSSLEINVPLEAQPPANTEDSAPSPTAQAEPDTPTPASSPTSPPSTPADQPESIQPAISVAPGHSAVGSDVTVELRGFPAQTPVDIGIGRVNAGYDVIAAGMTGPEGTMEAVVAIPGFVDPADEWVMVAAAEKDQVKVVSDRLNISNPEWEASVQVSPRHLEVGSTADVRARGFASGADLKIGIGRVNSEYDVIRQGKADQEGTLMTQVTIPDFVDPDDKWVIVVQEQGSPTKAVSDKLQVESSSSQAALVVLSGSASMGEAVDVQGSGFPAHAEVELGIGRVNSEYDLTDSVRTDAEGHFQTQFTIPGFVDPEDEWILVAVADDGQLKVFSEQVEITD